MLVAASLGVPSSVAAAIPDPTVLTIDQSQTTTNVLEDFTVTIHVSPDPGGGSVIGIVDGGTRGTFEASLGPGGIATRVLSFTAEGDHTIEVRFGGSVDFGPSSSTVSHTVIENRIPTTVSLTSDPNPSATFQFITFDVSVDPAPVGGQVLVEEESAGESTPWSDLDGSGHATLRWSMTTEGDHVLKACFSGSALYADSCSPTLIQRTDLVVPTVLLSASPDTIRRDGQTTLSVQVDPPPGSASTHLEVTGGVQALRWTIPVDPVTGRGSTFVDGSVEWGHDPLLPIPTAGTHQLVAGYTYGDGFVSSQPIDLTLTLDPTTTRLEATTSTLFGPDTFHVKATVSPIPPPGSLVEFSAIGTLPWGLAGIETDADGIAEGDIPVPELPIGTYQLQAKFDETLILASSEDDATSFDVAGGLPPIVSTPTTAVDLPARLGTSVPVATRWTGHDDQSGMRTYEVQRSLDGGPWTTVATSAASRYVAATRSGHGYRFRVRGIDAAGYASAWQYGPTIRPAVTQETGAAITYRGSWIRRRASTYAGGAVLASSTPGASATVRFTGRSIAWVTTRGPTRGLATIYVDGRRVGTVDLHASATHTRAVAFAKAWSTVGPHRLMVVVSRAGRRSRVDIDAFVILR